MSYDDLKKEVERLKWSTESRMSDLKSEHSREVGKLHSEIQDLNHKYNYLEERFNNLKEVVEELIDKANGIQDNQEESREQGTV